MHILVLMKGTYLLLLELDKDVSMMVGTRGVVDFKSGGYVYVGSGLHSLDARIRRHLRSEKKIHWHIDYLLPHTKVVAIFYKENTQREECAIAQVFEGLCENIPGFGCSDCSCQSHLFYGSCEKISQVARTLGMKPYRF